MPLRAALIAALILLAPAISHSHVRPLTLVKTIGPGWALNKSGWTSFVAFSPDGRTIAADAAASADDVSETLTLWSFPGGRLIRQLPAQPWRISPDWKYYASTDGVRELASGRVVIPSQRFDLMHSAFSADSHLIAVPGADRGDPEAHIRILALPSGKRVGGFSQLTPNAIAISADGVTLASGHWQSVKLWNLHTGQRLAVLHGLPRYAEGLGFSKNGRLLAASDGGHVQIWDVRHSRLLRMVEVAGWGSDPVFSPDGRLIAIGAYGLGIVSLIDVRRGRVIDHYRVSGMACGSAAFSPDGGALITPANGGQVTWPYDRGGRIRVFRVRR